MSNPGESKPRPPQQQPPPGDRQSFKVPRGPRYDLIFGIIFGGVAVWILMPVIAKHNNRKTKSGHSALSAKTSDEPAASHSKAKPKVKEKELEDEDLATDIAVEDVDDKKIKAKAKEKEKEPEVEVAKEVPPPPPVPKLAVSEGKKTPPPVAKAAGGTKAVAKASLKSVASASTPKAIAANNSAPKPGSTPKVRESAETGAVLTAKDVEARSDEALLDKIASSQNNNPFMTINNCQYQKDILSNCRNRCLLVTTSNGKTTNAVISGPSWADALREHEGTINITGKKAMIKTHEVFVVQSITFNLSTPKAVAPPKPVAPTKAPAYKGDKTTPGESYEDLGTP